MPNLSPTPLPPVILLCAPAGRFQESLRVLLSGLSLHVIGPAAEARSALALLDAWHPTLVVVDVALPEAELTAILHSLETQWPEVGRVALVDNADQMTGVKAQGIETVLLRGFRLDELYTAITSQLASAPVTSAPPATRPLGET